MISRNTWMTTNFTRCAQRYLTWSAHAEPDFKVAHPASDGGMGVHEVVKLQTSIFMGEVNHGEGHPSTGAWEGGGVDIMTCRRTPENKAFFISIRPIRKIHICIYVYMFYMVKCTYTNKGFVLGEIPKEWTRLRKEKENLETFLSAWNIMIYTARISIRTHNLLLLHYYCI